MPLFHRLLERTALFILLIGGLGMLVAMFLGAADVVGTQFLGTPVPGALELTESTMVLIVFGALTYAQRRRKHIRVEILYLQCGPRTRAGMDVLADVAALLFFGLLVWQSFNEAMFSYEIGEATVGLIRMPLYPARWILVAGVGLLMVQLVIDLSTDLRRLGGATHLEPAADDLLMPGLPDVPGVSDVSDSPGAPDSTSTAGPNKERG